MTAANLLAGIDAELRADLALAGYLLPDVGDILPAQRLDIRAALNCPIATAVAYVKSLDVPAVVVVGAADPAIYVSLASEMPGVPVYALPSVRSLALAVATDDVRDEASRLRRLDTWLAIAAAHVRLVDVAGLVAGAVGTHLPAEVPVVAEPPAKLVLRRTRR